MYFDELPLSDQVLDALWDMHFDECTPVQEKTIPVILDGRDVISCAQTGLLISLTTTTILTN